eukprot:Protomagalhaensia_wolfi_Nauph_80__2545@NODE_2703_length_1012_cov_2_867420_g2117_i0_p1_GENE_NODE_2703_length_1012_cov_2_867420_g2117_i0NODE_2703_length_1012_cov_2_867420_g2117_i0_p1_ORF_typecomplete_len123_score6_48_NODE_2703_length_1012_cov_2_867420_g2117_i0118486
MTADSLCRNRLCHQTTVMLLGHMAIPNGFVFLTYLQLHGVTQIKRTWEYSLAGASRRKKKESRTVRKAQRGLCEYLSAPARMPLHRMKKDTPPPPHITPRNGHVYTAVTATHRSPVKNQQPA